MAFALHQRCVRPRTCARKDQFRVPESSRPHLSVLAGAASVKKGGAGFIPIWKEVYAYLKEKNLVTVTPDEAREIIASGKWILVDVRRPDQYEKSHPEAAVTVPMYQLIDRSRLDATKLLMLPLHALALQLLKTVFYAFNGVTAIDANENFMEDAKKVIGNGTGVIFCCGNGGTMQTSLNFPTGNPSRSLQACYKVLEGGLTDQVMHLERGVIGWCQAGLPFIGDYEPDLGRSPMAAAAPTLPNQDQPKPKKKGWFF